MLSCNMEWQLTAKRMKKLMEMMWRTSYICPKALWSQQYVTDWKGTFSLGDI